MATENQLGITESKLEKETAEKDRALEREAKRLEKEALQRKLKDAGLDDGEKNNVAITQNYLHPQFYLQSQ